MNFQIEGTNLGGVSVLMIARFLAEEGHAND